MLESGLSPHSEPPDHSPSLRITAVSYLNTLPLVWGFLHGEQRSAATLTFSVPAVCADAVASGRADVGIVPVAELPRLNGHALTDVGIACRGAVRSILLVSKVPVQSIRLLAADSSSRTSVKLARILLEQRYGTTPIVVRHAPDLPSMLENADAALLIGDPALHLDPVKLPYNVLDLGAEWVEWSGLPMVFAVWAGKQKFLPAERKLFQDSCTFGLAYLDDIVMEADRVRGFNRALAREYLTRNIVFELGEEERRGMELYLRLAKDIN